MDYLEPEFISELYSKIYRYNNSILKQTNLDNYKPTAIEIIDLYITSNALSILKTLAVCEKAIINVGTVFNARCIIEGFAIKRFIQSEDFTDLNYQLLLREDPLIEYNQYKEFYEDYLNKIFDENLKENYENSRKFFYEKLAQKFSKKEIEQIIHTSAPFIADPHLNYKKLVSKYLNDEIAGLYSCLSLYTHPSVNIGLQDEISSINVSCVYGLIISEYEGYPIGKYSLFDFLYNFDSPFSKRFRNILIDQGNALYKVENVFRKHFDNNYVSNTIDTLEAVLKDIGLDLQCGLVENIKAKWKLILEIMATFYEVYFISEKINDTYDLAMLHYRLDAYKDYDGDASEIIDEAYSKYCNMYDNVCSKSEFIKTFRKSLGYLIDDKGKCPTIKSVVKDFLKIFEKSRQDCMLLNYVESQMISHANGYMYFSNTGVFSDINSIFINFDYCVVFIFNFIKSLFEELDEEKNYKDISNALRHAINDYQKNIDEKFRLLNLRLRKV